jgi:hypothetical protein
MTQITAERIRKFAAVAAAVAIIGFAGYAARKHGAQHQPPVKASTVSTVEGKHPPSIAHDYQTPSSEAEHFLRFTPDAVLASVNGHTLTAGTVLPPGSTNQSVSLDVCEYYRQRAVDRELIFQTAKAQEIGLNESQQQQLANLQRQRQQSGPDLVRNLTGESDSLSFELLDDQAFMLQTSLLEKSGSSPNVNSQQVSDYYHQHISEFGELPADELSRQEAWGRIDFKIRQTLAFSVRSDFQRKLADYMKRIETEANIQLTPLASFAKTQ